MSVSSYAHTYSHRTHTHACTHTQVFAQCGCLCEAMVSFEKAGCWQQVFSLSAQLRQDPAERMEVARRVAGESDWLRLWYSHATCVRYLL